MRPVLVAPLEVVVACNALNHSWDCNCGFGGDTGSIWHGSNPQFASPWGRGATNIEAYTNPNAYCPECNAEVIFYRSPYEGRVFFDPPLGPPWPKHPCTDLGKPVKVCGSGSFSSRVVNAVTRLQSSWRPLCYPSIRGRRSETRIFGNLDEAAIELALIDPVIVDQGPIFLRADPALPGFYQVAYLSSDKAQTTGGIAAAVELKFARAHKFLRGVAGCDAIATSLFGQFLFQEGDLNRAQHYLKRAIELGLADTDLDSLGDLLVIALMRIEK